MPLFRGLFGSAVPADNLRIIITRHGERADLALGPGWSRKVQSGHSDPHVSYLSPRADFREWENDPPLTVKGERQGRSTGRKLLQLGYPIDYCYASPAYRSIQTATQILQSQDRKVVPVNIEPGLFECPAWYAGAPLSFLPPESLAMDRHFNINADYSPVYNAVNPAEDETGYYKRSRRLIDKITKNHKEHGGTILLSGHAGSIEVITRGVLGRRARPQNLQSAAGKVDYCSFAILERDARTGQWLVHQPQTALNPHGGPMAIQTSIPLHQLSSQYFVTSDQTRPWFANKPYSRGDRSYRFRRRPRYYY